MGWGVGGLALSETNCRQYQCRPGVGRADRHALISTLVPNLLTSQLVSVGAERRRTECLYIASSLFQPAGFALLCRPEVTPGA